MNWIVAGLIAGVGAFFADYVMWGKVFTGREMQGFGTFPPTPEEGKKMMAANLPKSAVLALVFGVVLACFYQQLKAGLWADIVVFDPEQITDKATFGAPKQLSVGMQWVLVNGVPVIADGVSTNALPGRVLRGQGYQATR